MDAITIISTVGSILAMVFGLVALFRNKKADDTKEGREGGIVLTELGYIKAGVDDLKKDNREMRAEIQDMRDKIVRIEASTSHAHRRIDNLEKFHQPN